MASRITQKILELMAKGDIDFETHSYKIILMAEGYSFNPATHATYADVSASELTAGNGYTQNNKALASININRDDSLYKLTISWANATWTADGGSIGPACGAIIFDDSHGEAPIVQWIDFGTSGTVEDGGAFTVTNPKMEIATSI